MILSFAIITAQQASQVVLAPGIPTNFLQEVGSTIDATKGKELQVLTAAVGTQRASIPNQFASFANKYSQAILGATPTSSWKGYANPVEYKGVRNDKFSIVTSYATVNVKKTAIAVHFSNLGGTILIPGVGIDVRGTPDERLEDLVGILSKYTTFKFDRAKYEMIPMPNPGGVRIGPMFKIGLAFNFKGRGTNGPAPAEWWQSLVCFASQDLTIIRTNNSLWTQEVFGKEGLDPLFRKPNTNLSPLDEKFWKD